MTYNRTVGSFTPQPWMEHGSCADSPRRRSEQRQAARTAS